VASAPGPSLATDGEVMSTSTPFLALTATLRALNTRRARAHRPAASRPATSRARHQDLSLFPVCGHFPATAPVRGPERQR
jgi:hypothetical protein